MEEITSEYGGFLAGDAEDVRSSDVVVMGAGVVDLGLKALPHYKVYLNIVMALVNLGMVLGIAVKIALMFNVDNLDYILDKYSSAIDGYN